MVFHLEIKNNNNKRLKSYNKTIGINIFAVIVSWFLVFLFGVNK